MQLKGIFSTSSRGACPKIAQSSGSLGTNREVAMTITPNNHNPNNLSRAGAHWLAQPTTDVGPPTQ
jgi:hypothetical protein